MAAYMGTGTVVLSRLPLRGSWYRYSTISTIMAAWYSNNVMAASAGQVVYCHGFPYGYWYGTVMAASAGQV
jgi:hypothetical protein